MSLLHASGLHLTYPGGPQILAGATLTLNAGDRVAICGPSGCGKSSLLRILGTLSPPDSGELTFSGVDPFSLSDAKLSALRRTHLGFVFQEHGLLDHATALDNVLLPALAVSAPSPQQRARALELLDRVGLRAQKDQPAHTLSVGQKQRVAVARALLLQPQVLLADEPTGSLHPAQAQSLLDLLLEHAEDSALLMVTHAPELASQLDRTLWLREGQLETTP